MCGYSTVPCRGVDAFVFISYAHADRRYVDRLAAFLTRAGVPVWFDTEIDPGSRWRRVIRRKNGIWFAFVLVMTPAAEESEWVEREVTHAQDTNRPIVPLLLAGRSFFDVNNILHETVTGERMPGPRFVERL